MTAEPERERERERAALVEATTIDDLSRARILARVRRELDAVRQIDGLARTATAPAPDGAEQIRQRYAHRWAGQRTAGWARGVPLALIAAALVAWIAARWPVDDGVTLTIEGVGHVDRSQPAPVVELADGRLEAEVEPGRGTKLRVHTEEATVTVVGTVFSVDRAQFATDVAVVHGTVEVACVGRAPVSVSGGASIRCLPATAAALLRRIVALGASDPGALGEAVEAGLRAPDAVGPVRGELLAHQVRLRAAAGDPSALDSAEAYLATGETARRTEMLAFVASGRFARDRCGAIDALEAAVAADPRSLLAVALASCLVERDPARAGSLLDGIGDPGSWRSTLDDVRARLHR